MTVAMPHATWDASAPRFVDVSRLPVLVRPMPAAYLSRFRKFTAPIEVQPFNTRRAVQRQQKRQREP